MAPQDSFIDDEDDTWYVYSVHSHLDLCPYPGIVDLD